MLHPITFCIPEEKIVQEVYPKTKLLSSLIPGQTQTYIYTTERDYYNEYRQSYFAMTTKKGGWDCLRHYEILANGAVPFFPNIEHCPLNTMTHLPKILIQEGNALYARLSTKPLSELTGEDIREYDVLREKCMTHLRTFLTTEKMARYVLEKVNKPDAKRVLYLSGTTDPDYLRCLTLHGFKTALGKDCHDYPKVPHIYKDAGIAYDRLYGRGMTYTNLLEAGLHDSAEDAQVEENIRGHVYDLVIYGSYHRGMPYYDLVRSVYSPQDIVLFCGEDLHWCNYMEFVSKGHPVFVREL
jgi:hypothetical protein